MALTLRTNGSAGVNLVTSQWFNDYYNLLTGTMNDQPVLLKTDVTVQALGAAPGACTLAVVAGSTMSIGTYKYVITYVDNNGGETIAGTLATCSTTSGNQAVNLSNIGIGPAGTASRNIYRTKVGGSVFFLLKTWHDNTTTTYPDIVADSALTSQPAPPTHPTFGGLFLKDSTGTVQTSLFTDGTIQASGALLAAQVFDNGSRVAIQGTHSAGQPIISYGTGAPAALAANEIYIQLS